MAEESREQFGEYLRKQREIRGFSLEEIAEQTKISLRALRAIEAEDWEVLPAEIYVRGFIRSYCETIGLDPQEALLRFEEAYRPYKHQKEEKRSRETEYLAAKKRFPLLWAFLLGLILLLLVGGYFFWLKSSSSKNPSSPARIVPEEHLAPSLEQKLPLNSPPEENSTKP